MPDESEFLCGDWVWDAALREMRHYPRRKKGHAEQPDAVERLERAKAITLHTWSQQPMQSATGEIMSGRMCRVVVEYEDGRKLDINEDDRECASLLAKAIAGSFGLEVRQEGAPTGRRGGNLPQRDQMGRLVHKEGRIESILDAVGGELRTSRKKRLFGSERRTFRTSEIRRLELARTLRGPTETFTIGAVVGPEEERLPLAGYSGFEGWADPGEWREFAAELANSLGVEWAEVSG